VEPAVSPKQGSPSLPFSYGYVDKVYHGFSKGALKTIGTLQIVYSFDTFDMPVEMAKMPKMEEMQNIYQSVRCTCVYVY